MNGNGSKPPALTPAKPLAGCVFVSHVNPTIQFLNSGNGRPSTYKNYDSNKLYSAFEEELPIE